MRFAAISRSALGVLVLSTVGCSLIALSKRIVQEQCESDDDCKPLNDAGSPDFDSCHPYRCAASHYCEVGVLDADHDGFSARQCEHDPTKQDCDDSHASDHPGALEVCDARDNDCDQRVDEDVLEVDRDLVVDFGRDTIALQLGFTADLELNLLSIGFAFESQGAAVSVSQLMLEGASDGEMQALVLDQERPLRADALALGELSRSPFALATYAREAAPQLLIGSVNLPDTHLGLSPPVAASGASCAPDEDCGRAVPPRRGLALASGYEGTLLAYVRPAADSGGSICDAEPAAHNQLLANLFRNAASALFELTNAAVPIAQAADDSAPAVLALPATTANDIAHGFLIAFTTEAGALEFHQLSADASSFTVSPTLLELSSDAGPLHAPLLALGDRSDAHAVSVGLVAERGCGPERRLVAKRLTASLAIDGSAVLVDGPDWQTLGDGADQHGASLVWNARKYGTWALSFRDGGGLHARLFDTTLAPLGGNTYLLAPPSESAARGGDASEATAVEPLRSALGWFAVFAQTAGSSHGISRSVLRSCPGG